MTDKFTSHLGQKFRGGYCLRTWSNSSQALFTSPRSVTFISFFAGRPRIFSYPRTGYWAWPFLMQAVHMRLDIGPGPHNSPSKSCFSAPREKRRILILSSDLPYDLVLLGQIVTTRICLLMTYP